jgi:murein DD-endopeptidase MepM/ murein hydrolase activator NlpD
MLRKFWVILSFLGTFTLNAQQSDSLTQVKSDTLVMKSDTASTIKMSKVKWWDFDTVLIPQSALYKNSWDSLNVDEPKWHPAKESFGYYLCLADSTDCAFVHPVTGKINSKFGWRRYRMHKGIDIDLEIGDPVYAAFDGVVRISKYNYGGFGNYVMIRHYNGIETLYGHLSVRLVEPNQTVRAGDIIGLGGNTGRSTGPHLHFETRFLGQAFDPSRIIDFDSGCLKQTEIHLDQSYFPYLVNPRAYQSKYARYHKIRPGDTLWGLSRKYGTSVNALCRLNGIRKTTTLRVGRTLRVR